MPSATASSTALPLLSAALPVVHAPSSLHPRPYAHPPHDGADESCEHVAVLGDWERISKNPTRDWSANWYECYTEDEMLSREDELKLLIAIQVGSTTL